jgi:hypothetical protein
MVTVLIISRTCTASSLYGQIQIAQPLVAGHPVRHDTGTEQDLAVQDESPDRAAPGHKSRVTIWQLLDLAWLHTSAPVCLFLTIVDIAKLGNHMSSESRSVVHEVRCPEEYYDTVF